MLSYTKTIRKRIEDKRELGFFLKKSRTTPHLVQKKRTKKTIKREHQKQWKEQRKELKKTKKIKIDKWSKNN